MLIANDWLGSSNILNFLHSWWMIILVFLFIKIDISNLFRRQVSRKYDELDKLSNHIRIFNTMNLILNHTVVNQTNVILTWCKNKMCLTSPFGAFPGQNSTGYNCEICTRALKYLSRKRDTSTCMKTRYEYLWKTRYEYLYKTRYEYLYKNEIRVPEKNEVRVSV